ncbi:MAG: hypothetical protein KF861_10980, partial [Planctomycetaceae bacterium]|nr:hypothetical protein [Planctomycetaceae bacterium]
MPRFMLSAVVLTLLATPAAARDLDDALDGIVSQVQSYLVNRGETSVTVGTFSGPPSSSAGIRIKAALTERLKKADVQIGKLARLEVRGSFASSSEPNPIVQIKA